LTTFERRFFELDKDHVRTAPTIKSFLGIDTTQLVGLTDELKVWEVIDSLVNAAIDNLKEQILSIINANKITAEAIAASVALGLDINTTALIFNQDIIKALQFQHSSALKAMLIKQVGKEAYEGLIKSMKEANVDSNIVGIMETYFEEVEKSPVNKVEKTEERTEETERLIATEIVKVSADIKAKKADIERLEKEKQKTLKPLIEEKEQIEKEIEEIEKAADSREEKGKRNNIVPISTKEAERLLKHLSKKYGILGVLTDLLPEFTYGKFTTEKILINKNTYYDEKGDITFESKGFVNKTTIYHEYLHPFVQILERVNPELYEKIYQDSLSSDIDISHYIKDVRKEERVVRYLDKLSAQEKTPSLLQQFFDFLSDLFFKNKKSDYRTLQKLNTNTTVEELYNIFKNYGNLREDSEKVKEERFLKLEATQLENLINLNAGDVESHKTELEIIKQKLDLLNRYDVDKLQQLKQKLAEVNKKIDEVTKRFNAQIAQKQAELKELV
jgi:hypothetical protein